MGTFRRGVGFGREVVSRLLLLIGMTATATLLLTSILSPAAAITAPATLTRESANDDGIPPDALVHNRLGVEALENFDVQAAIYHFNSSLLLAREDEKVWQSLLSPRERCRFRRNLALAVQRSGDLTFSVRVSKSLLSEGSRRGAQEAFSCEDPTLFFLLGVGLFGTNEFEAAASAFSHSLLGVEKRGASEGISHLPTWLALGDSLLFAGEAPRAVEAYEHARELGKGEGSATSSLLRARAACADWREQRELLGEFRELVLSSTSPPRVLDGSLASAAGINFRDLLPLLQHRQDAIEAAVGDIAEHESNGEYSEGPRSGLTIGFITADLGVHPVAMLVRSALPQLARSGKWKIAKEYSVLRHSHFSSLCKRRSSPRLCVAEGHELVAAVAGARARKCWWSYRWKQGGRCEWAGPGRSSCSRAIIWPGRPI